MTFGRTVRQCFIMLFFMHVVSAPNIKCSSYDKGNVYLQFYIPDESGAMYIKLNKSGEMIERNCSLDKSTHWLTCLVPWQSHFEDYKAVIMKYESTSSLRPDKKLFETDFKENEILLYSNCIDRSPKQFEIKVVAEDVMQVSWEIRENLKRITSGVMVKVDGDKKYPENSHGNKFKGIENITDYKDCKHMNGRNVCLVINYYVFENWKCDVVRINCAKSEKEKPLFEILISVLGGLFGVVLIAFFIAYMKYKMRREREQTNVTTPDQTELLMNDTAQQIPPKLPPRNTGPLVPNGHREDHVYDKTSTEINGYIM